MEHIKSINDPSFRPRKSGAFFKAGVILLLLALVLALAFFHAQIEVKFDSSLSVGFYVLVGIVHFLILGFFLWYEDASESKARYFAYLDTFDADELRLANSSVLDADSLRLIRIKLADLDRHELH